MRVKAYQEQDVLEAAKERIREVFARHDTVSVMFSGGKDSLVCLHLVKEVAEELGQRTVNAVFIDEEVIPAAVLDFVNDYRQQPWLELLWYAVAMKSDKYVPGNVQSYIQFDPDREWVRQPPAWAIRLPEGDRRVFDQYTIREALRTHYRGKVCFILGIRAQESYVRLRACLSRIADPYLITDTKYGRTVAAKPIYDWTENDVFRYLYERKVAYCSVYDSLRWSGQQLRVATPLHSEAARRFDRLRAVDPELYQGIVRIFPEMILQERYGEEVDTEAVVEKWGTSWESVQRYIMEHFGDKTPLALKRLRFMRRLGLRRPELGYTPKDAMRYFRGGTIKRQIMPTVGKRKKA